MSNRFRKGDRVAITTSWPTAPIRYGFVRNPKPDNWGYIRVRPDSSLPGEALTMVKEDVVERYLGDETQYHLRWYRLRHISAPNIQAVLDLIDASGLPPEEKVRLTAVFMPDGFVPCR